MIHVDAPTCRECGSMVLADCTNCHARWSHDQAREEDEARGYARGIEAAARENESEAAKRWPLMAQAALKEAAARIRALAKETNDAG